MANTIRIKRSATTATPPSLAQGEIAYSESVGGSGNLFVGVAGAGVEKIGGNTDVVKLLGIEAGADVTSANETSHADVVVDGDFSTNGIMKRTGAGAYTTSATLVATTELSATGTKSSATFLRGDNTWATPAGSGDVSKVGTPVDNQIGVWTGNGTIEGDAAFTFNTATDILNVGATNDGTLSLGGTTFLNNAAGTITLSNIDNYGLTSGDIPDLSGTYQVAGSYETADATILKEAELITSTTLVGASNTTAASSLAIKAYVDAVAASEMTYMGGYNAATNTPLLDATPVAVAVGDTYTVTVAGTFFTTAVEVGDLLIAEINSAAVEADWTIINRNLDSVASSAITLTAGVGITGGGDLTANRTFNLDTSTLTIQAAIDGAVDYVPFYDTGVGMRKVLLNDMLDGGTF